MNKGINLILKWAGGKRQLLKEIKKYIPEHFKVYHEPFLGGGAVLLDLQPQNAIVNDSNEELINVYRVIKDDVDKLINLCVIIVMNMNEIAKIIFIKLEN